MAIQATIIRALDPTAEPLPGDENRALRVGDLNGKTLGLLCNGKLNAGPLLDALSKMVGERYRLTEVVLRTKPNANRPAPPEVMEDLARRCDAVIVGVGD